MDLSKSNFRDIALSAEVAKAGATPELVSLRDLLTLADLADSAVKSYTSAVVVMQKQHETMQAEIASLKAQLAEKEENKVRLWFGSMPESNGKKNYTAILYFRKSGLLSGPTFTLERSEFENRVRWSADYLQWMLDGAPEGKMPDITDEKYADPKPSAE